MYFIEQEASVSLCLVLEDFVGWESSLFLHKIVIPSLGFSPSQDKR